MASVSEIASLALIKLGQNPVFNIEQETNKTAVTMLALMNNIVTLELQANPWHFARKRIELGPTGIAPIWGRSYAYEVPADFLSIVSVGDDSSLGYGYSYGFANGYRQNEIQPYEIEGSQILTNIGPVLKLIYTANIQVYEKFPPLFAQAIACRLAAEACETITGNTSKKQVFMLEYDAAIKEAMSTDAMDVPKSGRIASDLELARY